MSDEENYEDLTALFESQDTAFDAGPFVQDVMAPIRKISKWRVPFLFGAAGLGLGAAISQVSAVMTQIPSAPRPPLQMPDAITANRLTDMFAVNPMWALAAGTVVICLGYVALTERA